MNIKGFKIFLWIVSFQLIGGILGLLTQSNIHPWYETLVKSNLTPSPIVFSVVWPLLYVLLAIAAYLLWQERKTPKTKLALYCFIIQMVMNWAWTPIFFEFHWMALSFFWILAMVLLTLTIIFLNKSPMRIVSLLLMPYLIWLVFAGYLNGFIWLMN